MTKIDDPTDCSTYLSESMDRAMLHGFKRGSVWYEYVADSGLIWIHSMAELYICNEKETGEWAAPADLARYDLTAYYKYMVQFEYEYFYGKLPFPVPEQVAAELPSIEELEQSPDFFWAWYQPCSGEQHIQIDPLTTKDIIAESFNR